MRDENPIRTLGAYSKLSHKGYRNTIELPVGNNVVPLRSDIIWLVQNGCSFHGLRSEDPNQHLKDFLKLVDSLDLDGSITTWEDLTTRFIAQLFTLGRTAKLRNDILMFQQHHGESLSEAWTRFKDLLQKVPHHGIDLWLKVQIFYDHVNPVTRRTIDQLASGKLRDRNAKEPCALLEDLALYDNESWNDPRDFAKLVKAITLPQDVLSTSDRRLIKLENQELIDFNAHQEKRRMNLRKKVVLSPAKLCENAYETDEEVERKKKVKDETKGDIEKEEEGNPKHFDTFPTMNELRYHEWLLKNPRLPWVKAKIRRENLNNVKFSCMIGQFNKEKAYLDLESPINIMSRLHYNWIMSNRLEPRRKPSNPKKNCNFIGRVKGLRIFIRNFIYECDFMVLEETTSVIDHYLGSVVFGNPFVEATGLVYNKKEGTVVFERDKEMIIFKMPHKMDMFKHVDFTDRGTDSIPPFVIESDDDNCEKIH
nr:zinc finger, CCHC-type [Tanacetum cinerariifolium]